MNGAVGSESFLSPDRKSIPRQVAQPTAGLLNNQGARRRVPRAKLHLPESVYSTASQIAEIQSRRAAVPDALRAGHECFEKAQIKIGFFTLIIGEAGAEKRLIQLLNPRNPYGAPRLE